MRSCSDVLHRLLHDTNLNLSQDAIIGYLDRFKGILELPLHKFSSAQIPFHRIAYFRHGCEVIWHKQTRLDLLFESTDRAKAFTSEAIAIRKRDLQQAETNRLEMQEKIMADLMSKGRSLPSVAAAFSDLVRVPVHFCSALSDQWVSSDSSSQRTLQHSSPDAQHTIQIATYNVLDDHYLSHAMKNWTLLRWQAIIRQIKQNPAHFWILTEATPQFASILLEDRFIRKSYCASDSGASSFQTLSGEAGCTGQLVLIRRDVAVQSVFFTSTQLVTGKRLVFVLARFSSGIRLALCAIHLTSGQLQQSRLPAAVDKRRQQLQYILSKLDQLQDECDLHIIAGDFNFKGELDEDMGRRLLYEFTDADGALTSATYDPNRNSLAALHSNQTTPMRLDRVYIRQVSKDGSVQLQDHHILGQDPICAPDKIGELHELLPHGLHPSDHFGLISTFASEVGADSGKRTASWSTASALAVIPEYDVRESVDTHWRAEYDPSHQKWPAHINLMYPFVNVEAIPEVCSSIRSALSIQPYNIPASLRMGMDGVGTFKHKSSHTVYLSPADDQFRKLHEVVRKCVVQMHSINTTEVARSARRPRSEYVPHMTIAKLKGHESVQVHEFVKRAETQLSNLTEKFNRSTVNSLSVLQRFNGKMIVVDRIQLPTFTESDPGRRSFQLVKSITRHVFGEESKAQVIPVGSSVLLDKGLFSDIDVVVLPPEASKEREAPSFFHKMRSLLPEDIQMRLISDARCPIISLCVRNPDYLPIDIIFGDGEYTREVINDSSALQARIRGYDAAKKCIVKEALRQLKRWAKSKQFCGRAFNLFPGIVWPIALFCVLAHDEEKRLEDWRAILIRFFDVFCEMDWKRFAVTVDGKLRRDSLRFLKGRDCRGDGCIIVAPTSASNVAEFVVSAVVKSFSEEAKQALAALRTDSWGNKWNVYVEEVKQIESLYEYRVDIVVRTPNGADREELSGWLKGKFVGIIERHFESKGIALRPSAQMRWSTVSCGDGPMDEGIISCGVDAELTVAEPSSWQRFVSEAEMELRDRLLRHERWPLNSTIAVALKRLLPE